MHIVLRAVPRAPTALIGSRSSCGTARPYGCPEAHTQVNVLLGTPSGSAMTCNEVRLSTPLVSLSPAVDGRLDRQNEGRSVALRNSRSVRCRASRRAQPLPHRRRTKMGATRRTFHRAGGAWFSHRRHSLDQDCHRRGTRTRSVLPVGVQHAQLHRQGVHPQGLKQRDESAAATCVHARNR
jgi:hypothetical protein